MISIPECSDHVGSCPIQWHLSENHTTYVLLLFLRLPATRWVRDGQLLCNNKIVFKLPLKKRCESVRSISGPSDSNMEPYAADKKQSHSTPQKLPNLFAIQTSPFLG